MPTRRTGRTLLNPQGRWAWRDNGLTEGRDLWEMHEVWEWDFANKTGAILVENTL